LKESALRQFFRNSLFRLLRKISSTDEAREIWSSTLKGQLAWQPRLSIGNGVVMSSPYEDLGMSDYATRTAQRSDIIFITSRFRSGSTLLWNLFRNMPDVTAYYEPFNERRWFDPRMRGDRVDPTHAKVDEYWREYEKLEILGEYYCDEWIERNLYMDASFWAPKMKRYVELMIEKAPGRPVLQFNRIDFRLPWFRRNFPHAIILYLYRHPRDQWCSTLVEPHCVSRNESMKEFAIHDRFYLRMWGRDLKYHFPFLHESFIGHPYQLFYYIWKLSYLFGRTFADYSIAFENILADPDEQLKRLLQASRVQRFDINRLKSLIERPKVGKWKNYADEKWFRRHESICETTLDDFFTGVSAETLKEAWPEKAPVGILRRREASHKPW
jgi:hypothetical protein